LDVWLVLADANDDEARWLSQGLARGGGEVVELVTADDLASGQLQHRLGPGENDFRALLPDGREIASREVSAVLNRLIGPPEGTFGDAAPSDRLYAEQEWWAFMLGWLQAFGGPVMNPAGPRGLCGAWRYPSEWRLLAHSAGLSTLAYRADAPEATVDGQALVVGEQAFVTEGLDGLGPACARLAALAGTPLLEVLFTRVRERPLVVGATPLPRLRPGGEAVLNAVIRLLRDRSQHA
jgi:hypothetical protein